MTTEDKTRYGELISAITASPDESSGSGDEADEPAPLVIDDSRSASSNSSVGSRGKAPQMVSGSGTGTAAHDGGAAVGDEPRDAADEATSRGGRMRSAQDIWRSGDVFPGPEAPAPLPPTCCSLFAFRSLLLDRRKLFQGASRFIHNDDDRYTWQNRGESSI